MTRSKFFLTRIPALGLAALLAQPVAAMTCAEFEALDEDGQMQAVNDMAAEAGGAEKENETPLEEGAEGSEDAVAVETDEATNVDAPRGDEHTETITVIRDGCANDPEFDMSTVNVMAPKEK